MTTEALDVDELLTLAREKSDQARSQLFEVMGDIFLARGTVLSLQERSLMVDILEKLIQEVSRDIRRKLALKLAEAPGTPRELAVLLANDDIDVASPILLQCKALQDVDLVEIIRHRSIQHMLAISMRRDLSTTVADALVENGSNDVILSLLENPDAQIGRATMAYLVEQSKAVDEFQEPLARRQDLPRDLAVRMCFWVAAAIRRYILEKFTISADEIDDALEPLATDLAASLAAEKQQQSAADGLARQLGEQRKLTPRLLIQTLRRGEIPLFEAMMGEMCDLRVNLVRRICYEPGAEGLAVAARAIGLSREEFATIFLLTRKAKHGPAATDPGDLGRALVFFDRVSHSNAEAVLNRWRRDPNYLFAIKSVDESQGRQSA